MDERTTIARLPDALQDRGVLGQELSRRTMLKGGATTVAALGLGAMWSRSANAAVGGPGGLQPRSDLLMLVNRVSQGFTLAEMARATSLGYAGYLDYATDALMPTPLASAYLAPFLGSESWTPAQVFAALQNPDDVLSFTQRMTLGRSVLSENILLERMMDFWSNRLNVYAKKQGNAAFKHYGDYVIRQNALGDAKALLTEFAHDTSVLHYLDNIDSGTPIANENWAREFLELYTMGQVDPISGAANYTEDDVQAAAKAFTGWSVDLYVPPPPLTNPHLGLFLYKPIQHITGPKVFQGIQLFEDASTTYEGDQVVSIVVNSLKTGRGMAAKMIRHLLRYDPQAAQVNSASLLYRSAGVPAMVQDILSQANVSALTPDKYLFASPSRFVYQAMRASGASPVWTDLNVLGELQRMGNAPFEWPAPDGYPITPEKWAGGIFSRWEFANKLFGAADAMGAYPLGDVHFDDTQIMALLNGATTIPGAINAVNQRFTGGVLSENEKSVLLLHLQTVLPAPYDLSYPQAVRELCALTISSPTFQYY